MIWRLSLGALRNLIIFCGLFLLGSTSASARGNSLPTAVIANQDGAFAQVQTRIFLDKKIQPTALEQARLIIILGDNANIDDKQWLLIEQRLAAGAGLLIFPGEKPPKLERWGIKVLGEEKSLAAMQPTAEATKQNVLSPDIAWPSAPQIGRRWLCEKDGNSRLRPLITTIDSTQPLLWWGKYQAGQIAIFSLQFNDVSNRELILWPYFNYLLYSLATTAAGETPSSYATWPAAPVPQSRTLIIFFFFLAIAWIGTLWLFRWARRYSKAHPEILVDFFNNAAEVSTTKQTKSNWQAVGFARPLAGFLTLAGTLVLLFAPFYYVTNILIPNHVQPFPQAKGIWEFAWEALQIAWFLFDAGTFVAFVKYFAEYRHKEPAEAVRSTQFFVWWQILTGLVQITMAVLVAVFILPHTRYSYSANFVILIALSQYPGFFGVITFFFQAYQRFDYNISLDLLSDWVLRFALMIPCVILGRRWGIAHPAYGEAIGAALGIGVGYYLSTIVTFGVSLVLYRRLKLRLLPLFLAHFDASTARRMLSFGLKVVAGQAFFRAAMTIDRVVISLLLINYTEWLGIQGQIHYNLMFLFPIAYRFFETAMAALSESHGNKKTVLTQYYIARYFQVGSLYTAIGVSLLWALGPSFVHFAMDPQWARAGDYLLIAAAIGIFYAPAWLSDMLQKGADRPGLFAWVLGAEQALRISLFWLLIPRWQFRGYYLALLITIALKVFGAWLINHLVIVRLRLYYWAMFIGPALAGLGNFVLWRLVGKQLALTGRTENIIFFFVASLASFPICFFLAGLVGAFDRAFAVELEQASRMTGLFKPLSRFFYWAARAGYSLSPLHNRLPVTIYDQAQREAEELQKL